MYDKKNIFVTGASGSLGFRFISYICKNYTPKKLIIISRNEYHSYKLNECFGKYKFVIIKILDIRDLKNKDHLFNDIDYFLHTSALKHVGLCEHNPFEAIKTNIDGSKNIIHKCIHNNVKKCIFISTDKANNPNSLYGGTKLIADKLAIYSNIHNKTKFSVLRLGNFFGSKGSILEKFISLKNDNNNNFTISSDKVTRSFIEFDNIISIINNCFKNMIGGEIFVPCMKSIKIIDLPYVFFDNPNIILSGLNKAERIHEILISFDEINNTYKYDNYYIIIPKFNWWLCEHKDFFDKKYQKIDYENEITTNDCSFYSICEIKKMVSNFSCVNLT